ncbi:MAG: DUF1932 domain-containing protein [Inquilinaceae bacterium]
MKVAFLGFSEAGSAFAEAMMARGARVTACDPGLADPSRGTALVARAKALGVPLTAGPGPALKGAELIVSTVTAASALAAAKGTLAHLNPGHVYLDLNSCGPATKVAIAEAIAPSGAAFVEGAALGLVGGNASDVPLLLCGPKAGHLAVNLRDLGLNARDLGPAFGAASTAKLLRSVFVKGFEALIDETVAAAEAAGIREAVMESLADTFSMRDFRALATHHLARLAAHGPRRAEELHEAASLLRALNIAPHITEAAARRQAAGAGAHRGKEHRSAEPINRRPKLHGGGKYHPSG